GMDRSRVSRYVAKLINCLNQDCINWTFIPETISTCDNWPPISYKSERSISLNSNLAEQNFIGIRIGDVSGNWNHDSAKKAKRKKIRMRNHRNVTALMDVTTGTSFTVPIVLNEVKEIEGIDINVSFESAALKVSDVTLNESMLEHWNYELSYNTNVSGQLIITIFAKDDVIAVDGDIAFITFDVIAQKGDTCNVILNDYDCNEKPVFQSGGFNIEETTSYGFNVRVIHSNNTSF
ncbi:Cellulosome anchoring protein, cohesin region domain protein, partial [Candidatus Magnetomorum sp. HK-1]